MTLNLRLQRMNSEAEERRFVIGLARGIVAPTDGMQRHFLRVIGGEAHPLTTKEHEWLAIWQEHLRNARTTPAVHGHSPRECVDCGESISDARLAAMPDSIRCVPCQEVLDRSSGRKR